MEYLQDNHKIVSYKIANHYLKKYGSEAKVIIQSPGRINIMGEHTDYNEGYVLPAAIDHNMYVAISENQSQGVNLYSIDYDQNHFIVLDNKIVRTEHSWANLISGFLSQLSDQISGINLAFGGNIPEGAGVSFSAALCCGVVMALSELFELNLDKWEMARIAQKAEHDFALVECGIMDQFACLFGLTNHVLLLDCKTLKYEESEIDTAGYKFVLLNSNVKHNLKSSAYNLRRHESANALKLLKISSPSITTYQDVSMVELKKMKGAMLENFWKRAVHIVSENERVIQINERLKGGDHEKVGQLLTEGHESEKHFYEITCKETDFIVYELIKYPIVLGARQVGGGFGGCILALVKDTDVSEVIETVASKYKKRFSLKLQNIPIKISRGCHRIK